MGKREMDLRETAVSLKSETDAHERDYFSAVYFAGSVT